MGLLDSPEMGFAIGLLGASGPSRMPVSLGQALQAGYGSAMQARDQSQAAAMRQMQMDAAKREQEAAQQRQLMLSQYRSQLSPQEQMQFDLDPQGFIKQKFAKPEEYTLTPGAARFRGNEQIASVPTAPKESTPPALVAEIQAWEAMPPGPQKDMMGRILQARAKGDSGGTPYFTPIPTEMGLGSFNNRTGGFSLVNGGGIVKPSDSPMLQGQLAVAKETGKTEAEIRTKAKADVGRVVDNANMALRLSDELLKHPGFTQAVGASSMLGIQKIPGTQAKDFMNRLDQLRGGAFLEAFNTLKGGGQITEVEGKKATDAIARMDNATSEEAFKAAVKDYQDVIRMGVKRAEAKAGGATADKTIVRTGMYGGRKVVQYSDGTTDYAD